jgi:glycolate oxidase FAD binding subunit
MAGTGLTIVRRIRSLLGADGVVETDTAGVPRAVPHTEDGLGLVLREASEAGWRVRVEGAATWMPADAPADLTVSTAGLTGVTHLDPPDLVASVAAGTRWQILRDALADHGTWLAVDPPGDDRTIGSIVATGTSGPLRLAFGAVRDHVLGLTLVTGDGRVVRPGGRVVKNVAGFDVTRLAVGSYGAFGVLTSVTLRLRAVPRSDVTLAAHGARDQLLDFALDILSEGETPAALELIGSAGEEAEEWRLGVRLVGSDPAVQAQRDNVIGATGGALQELESAEGRRLWQDLARAPLSEVVSLRLGALPTSVEAALDLVEHHLPDGRIAVSVGTGMLRWSGEAAAERLRLLRHAAAQQEMPVTLERAPWPVRDAIGHFGAYREGVGRLVTGLRRTFDPAGILVTGADTE